MMVYLAGLWWGRANGLGYCDLGGFGGCEMSLVVEVICCISVSEGYRLWW